MARSPNLRSGIGTRRYNLPVRHPSIWPRDATHEDTVGDLFLRQRLLLRTTEEWPHHLWEAVLAALMRELARSRRLAPWLRAFNAGLEEAVCQPRTADQPTSAEFLKRLRALRVSPPQHRQMGAVRPPAVIALLVGQFEALLSHHWSPANGYEDADALRRDLQAFLKRKRAALRGMLKNLRTADDLGPIVAKGIGKETRPDVLARRLVGAFLGLDERTVRTHSARK